MGIKASFIAAAVISALLSASCGDGDDIAAAVSVTATPTPNIEATVVAEVEARLEPAATLEEQASISDSERAGVVEFFKSQQQIIEDWDQHLVDFDTWRRGLISCDASSVEAALSQFAATYGGIEDEVRGLSRFAQVRALTDNLVDATEGEARAVRALRDGWTPEDASVFETLDLARAAASDTHGGVRGTLGDFLTRITPKGRARETTFAVAIAQLDIQWDGFRENYDSFRAQEPTLTSVDVVSNLSQLVDEFRGIVNAVRKLRSGRVTLEVATMLADAAEAEDLALRRIRGTFERQGSEAVSGMVALPTPSASSPLDELLPDNPSTGTPAVFAARDPTLFDAFDLQLAAGNASRRKAANLLSEVKEEVASDAQADVQVFVGEFQDLVDQRDRFYSDYDEWRRTRGGCSTIDAKHILGQFISDFASITRRARGVPGGPLLGSLRELLVEAAELEDEGLRVLGNTWRPYDVTVYSALDRQRSISAKLLRQVAVGLDSLLTRHELEVVEP